MKTTLNQTLWLVLLSFLFVTFSVDSVLSKPKLTVDEDGQISSSSEEKIPPGLLKKLSDTEQTTTDETTTTTDETTTISDTEPTSTDETTTISDTEPTSTDETNTIDDVGSETASSDDVDFEDTAIEESVTTNLIANPGFESGTDGKASNWGIVSRKSENSIQWVSDDVHSGNRAMKLVANVAEDPGKSMGVYSDFIPVPEEGYVAMSAWIKANDIVSPGSWYKGRVVLTMFDSIKNKIKHSDIQIDGSVSDWEKISIDRALTTDTKFIQITFFLTSCTGTMWVDDVELTFIPQPPAVELTGIYNPVIFPTPWKAEFGNESFSIGSLAIVIDSALEKEVYLEEALKEFFTQIGISSFEFFSPNDAQIGRYETQLLVGDLNHTTSLVNQFEAKFPENSTQEIGDQGYFLSATQGSQNIIYLGAKNQQGRFNGFQTLKQAINIISDPKAYVLDIIDTPTLERRGMVMGVQWYSKQKDAIARLSQLKGNFVLNHGSFLNHKFMNNWREDFTSNELTSMENYLSLCQKNFVTPRLNFGPRSSDPELNPVTFSSDGEINLIVEKIKQLYEIGFRHFGLNFDDLKNVGQEVLLTDADKFAFGDNIGKAHAYFTQSVYNRIIEACPDIDFSVLPMHYNIYITDKQKIYLEAFASLPEQIAFIACTVTDEDILNFKEATNRKITIWSNFFAQFQAPDYPIKYSWPFLNNINWENSDVKSAVDGFVFLPIIPDYEDPSNVSWKTAADFMWSPERYISPYAP